MKRIIYIGSILLLGLISCERDSKPLEGHYFINSSSKLKRSNLSEENIDVESYLSADNFLDFFKDGTYSIYLNRFEHGNYSLKSDTIFLNPLEGQKWQIRFIEDAEKLGHFVFPNAEKMVTLSKLSNNLDADYPFLPELNTWRMANDRKLTNNELIEKFQNYTSFMRAYMRWAEENELHLSFKRISGPLQYANNGLMMRKLKDTGAWCSYFVEGDCERMDKILRHYFDGLIIDWKYTHHRIEMLIDALEQVSKGMEDHKEYFVD